MQPLTVTVEKLQPVMNPVIGLLPASLLKHTHEANTELFIEIYCTLISKQETVGASSKRPDRASPALHSEICSPLMY